MSNAQNNPQQPPPTPTPPLMQKPMSAKALNDRLNWGEPAFTIIDVRDRSAFNQYRIMGAIPIPRDELVEQVQDRFDPRREIYVYADEDGETENAAAKLREAGFEEVAGIQGGLKAWKAVDGPTEGTEERA
ncbi:MAG: rhodanese-like domain-containing protein [Cyanobacteria bacterium QH_8_48_120]|nr:MAG: rhodanese-like domain-containing protein [Cyanobacteria bacterium QH_8_48_120]